MNLGAAINRAMQESDYRIQQPLADALGIDQGTLSRYINGRLAVTVEVVARIEDLCGLPRGQILTWGGYVRPDELLVDDVPTNIVELKRPPSPAEPAISLAARGVDLDELRERNPAAYEEIQRIAREALASGRRRRKS